MFFQQIHTSAYLGDVGTVVHFLLIIYVELATPAMTSVFEHRMGCFAFYYRSSAAGLECTVEASMRQWGTSDVSAIR